jgi:hypothetical protein
MRTGVGFIFNLLGIGGSGGLIFSILVAIFWRDRRAGTQ